MTDRKSNPSMPYDTFACFAGLIIIIIVTEVLFFIFLSDSLEFFSPTDGDWPSMMRVNAIINWNYSHVWDFIRGLYLPYCSLYDRG